MKVEGMTWLYYKVYFGEASNKIDWFVVNALRKVLELCDHDCWFFIRYTDDGGPHIRLRMRIQTASLEALAADIESALSRYLDEMDLITPGSYKPFVSKVRFLSAPRKHPSYNVRFERCHYEPEVDNFGGPILMESAHKVFEQSSTCAIEILRAEEGRMLSRKSLAPLLMDVAISALPPPDGDSRAFWKRYSDRWIDSAMIDVDFLHKQFRNKIETLSLTRSAVLPNPLSEATEFLVKRWGSAIEDARRDYEGGLVPEQVMETLRSSLIHLMNNRLGITIFDECYLSFLLSHFAIESVR